MQVIRNLGEAAHIHNPAIHKLVVQRINDLGGEVFNATALGCFLVVEHSDTLEALQTQLGFSIVANRVTHIRYDHAGFTPSFEFIEDFPCCFDMVIVLSDSGYGVEIFIPKDADPDLIAMCALYAVTASAGI